MATIFAAEGINMRRRGFLTGLAGILIAGTAPAIVRQPMKIWVPKPTNLLAGLGADFDGDTVLIAGKRTLVRQDAFGEAFFPTNIIMPDDVGYKTTISAIRRLH